jgi:hypothetical protein
MLPRRGKGTARGPRANRNSALEAGTAWPFSLFSSFANLTLFAGKVFDAYRAACAREGFGAVGPSDFSDMCAALEGHALIATTRAKGGALQGLLLQVKPRARRVPDAVATNTRDLGNPPGVGQRAAIGREPYQVAGANASRRCAMRTEYRPMDVACSLFVLHLE